MRYRVYLIDESDRIKAAEAFTALNEAEAPKSVPACFAPHIMCSLPMNSGERHRQRAAVRTKAAYRVG